MARRWGVRDELKVNDGSESDQEGQIEDEGKVGREWGGECLNTGKLRTNTEKTRTRGLWSSHGRGSFVRDVGKCGLGREGSGPG